MVIVNDLNRNSKSSIMDICPILNDANVSSAIHDENVLNVVRINLLRKDIRNMPTFSGKETYELLTVKF